MKADSDDTKSPSEPYDDGPTPTGVKPKPVSADEPTRPSDASRAEAEGWAEDSRPEERISLEAVPMPVIKSYDSSDETRPAPMHHADIEEIHEFDDEMPQSRTKQFIAAGVLVALVGGGAGYWFLVRPKMAAIESPSVAQSAATPNVAAPSAEAPNVAAPTAAPPSVPAPKVAAPTVPAPKVAAPKVAKGEPPKIPTAGEGNAGGPKVEQARNLYKHGQVKPAIALLKKVVKAEPRNDAALVLLANCYLDHHSTSHALATAQKATHVNPKNADGFLVLGAVYQKKGRRDKTRRAYETYLKLAPNGPFAGELRSILAKK